MCDIISLIIHNKIARFHQCEVFYLKNTILSGFVLQFWISPVTLQASSANSWLQPHTIIKWKRQIWPDVDINADLGLRCKHKWESACTITEAYSGGLECEQWGIYLGTICFQSCLHAMLWYDGLLGLDSLLL